MKGIVKVPKRRRLDAEERALMIANRKKRRRSWELGARRNGCTEDLRFSGGVGGSIPLSPRHFNCTGQMTLLYRLTRCPAAQSARWCLQEGEKRPALSRSQGF